MKIFDEIYLRFFCLKIRIHLLENDTQAFITFSKAAYKPFKHRFWRNFEDEKVINIVLVNENSSIFNSQKRKIKNAKSARNLD